MGEANTFAVALFFPWRELGPLAAPARGVAVRRPSSETDGDVTAGCGTNDRSARAKGKALSDL